MILPETTAIVLVDPHLPANVGAVARAMKNMGYRELRLVPDRPGGGRMHLSEDARRMSSGSADILEAARVFDSLGDCLADLNLVVGCSVRRGRGRHPVFDPARLVAFLEGSHPESRAGLVFGREDHGLRNHELDLCNLVLTIPTAPEHPSLNLAQAVLLVCYELSRAARGPATSAPRVCSPLATSEELEGLYRHAREVLLRIGFLHPQNPDRILRVLRRVLGRAQLDSREATIFRGILRQMDWYARKHAGREDPATENARDRKA